ncbi:hypothetical protein GW750_01200 [bacterium]|nr:hypothetical protein [bacterium]
MMVESCQMGLFKGSKGMFLPTREITYGQAITVMMRMLYGYQDETGDHFATNYMKLAYENDYIAKATLDTKAKRDMNIPR